MSTPVAPHADPQTSLGPGLEGSGLADGHFREVVRLVRLLPGRWLIERCEDDLGIVSVLLVQDVEGAGGLMFALFRFAHEFYLDLCQGSCFQPLGEFETVTHAMAQVMSHVLHGLPRVGQGRAAGEGKH